MQQNFELFVFVSNERLKRINLVCESDTAINISLPKSSYWKYTGSEGRGFES